MSVNNEEAFREIYWNVQGLSTQVIMYGIFALSMVVFVWGIFRRYQLWSGGLADDSRFNKPITRFIHLFKLVFLQRKTNREAKAKIFHTLIVWGFLALLFATTMVFIHQDLGIEIYQGRYYLAVSILADVFGLALFIGVCLAIRRRYVEKPDKLHNSKSDFYMLVILALLCFQGFLLEGMRIHVTDDPWARFSPVGMFVSWWFGGMSESIVRILHATTWWIHAVNVFLFFALLPYSKFFHIIGSSLNLFFQDLDRKKGALPNPGDLEKIMEAALEDDGDGEFKVGTSSIEDYTWKQRLDLDACTSCGRCQSVCPAYGSGKVLSPKWLILDTRNHMLSLHAQGKLNGEVESGGWSKLVKTLNSVDRWLMKNFFLDSLRAEDEKNGNHTRCQNELVENEALLSLGENVADQISGGVLNEDVFWSCTTCRACEEICPVGIQHVDHIVASRRNMALMEGNIPSEAQPALKAIETRGNPFGPADERANWTEGLDVRVLHDGDEVDVLYWVGCISSYDKRKQKIARSLASILNAAGVSWGILGNRECCTGDPARRLGEENLFQTQVKSNIDVLQGVKCKTILANCPHCFNSIKNEYPDFGDPFAGRDVEVVHHSHFIKRLIDSGEIEINSGFEGDITFHDPCYLGRYNDTYDEPRDVLVKIGGTNKLREMEMSKDKGLCCGAGGGHFWFDMKVGERINVQRINQAADTGASTVATGCPFCMQMMEDGAKLTDREESIAIRDIAEIVAEAMK